MNWNLLNTLLESRATFAGNVELLVRIGNDILGERLENLPDKAGLPNEAQVLYKFMDRLGRRQGMTEDVKVKHLKQFLKLATTSTINDQNYIINSCLLDAGWIEPVNVDLPRLKIPNEHLKRFHNRSYHQEIITHCQLFFEGRHYSTAVLEAAKAYNSAVKKKSGLVKDGADLMMAAFSDSGTVKVNSFKTDSEKNEQKGIMFLSAGIVQAFRNPTAHETALHWKISEENCLDILSFISYLFKKLDDAGIYSK